MAPHLSVCLLALLAGLSAPVPAAGGERTTFAIDPPRSEARFYLQAPRHGVEGRSRALEGSVEIGAGGLSDARGGRARLEVASLHAGNRLIDRNMRGALEADRHPEIVFEAARFERRAGPDAPDGPDAPGLPAGADGPWRGVVTGDLTVRGVTRPVSFDVEATRRDTALTASGSAVFKLTDFGIDPPRFLGFLRVKDWVRVEFDVTATPAARPGAARDAAPAGAPAANGGSAGAIATPPEAP